MKTFQVTFCWILSAIFCFISSIDAFAVIAPCAAPRNFALNLRPSQAADLEACAYDLMKEALAKKKAETLSKASDTVACPSTGGPIAWCRRMMILHKSPSSTAVSKRT